MNDEHQQQDDELKEGADGPTMAAVDEPASDELTSEETTDEPVRDVPIRKVAVASWEDFDVPDTITIEVVDDGGDEVVVYGFECKIIPFLQWRDLARVPRPAPQMFGTDPDTGRPMYNTADPAWQNKVAEAEDKVVLRRVLASLVMNVPGETEEEQIQNLSKKFRSGHLFLLYNRLKAYHERQEGAITDLARSFHRS